eukprot:gene15504-17083_t
MNSLKIFVFQAQFPELQDEDKMAVTKMMCLQSQKTNQKLVIRITISERLNSYCYSEYFTKEILVQVLHKALELRSVCGLLLSSRIRFDISCFAQPQRSAFGKQISLEHLASFECWIRNYWICGSCHEDWQNEEDVKEEIANRPVVIESPEPEASPAPIKTPNRHNLQTRSELEEAKAIEDEKNKKKERRQGQEVEALISKLKGKKQSLLKERKKCFRKKRTPSARKGGSRLGTGKKNKVGQDKKPEDEKIETDVKRGRERISLSWL